ncbi:MAG: ComEA family DNA-binding protein [Coriobacteriia bacterium]|nr:ComEA family DNA-binding protein [Coriobacteriia bacterium]
MAKGKDTVLSGLENLSFVERLSSRFEIPPRLLIGLTGSAIVLLLLVVFWTSLVKEDATVVLSSEASTSGAIENAPTDFDNSTAETQNTLPVELPQTFVVYVTGAVSSPGLYTVSSTSRVGDAVQAAGGLSPEAASAVVNLAQMLTDGMQIHIPSTDEVESNAPVQIVQQATDTAAPPGGVPSLVNINTADSATLQTLTGVGPATAQKIIEYRTTYGPFASKEALRQVSGIGEKKYAAVEAFITI